MIHIDMPDYIDTLDGEREPSILQKPKVILTYKVKTNNAYAKTKNISINHMYIF